ncbi:hypothetical protein SAMN05444722_2981 [Rhodovulum sp. ES.010]|uniref:hypothetical protein n=1 Tax=Rhodovulum sp. ES.010 TaxID=1882821 RepID=UPI00092A0ED7|nr:hypothetical protein [Rhodovulum sp. ES.010]SIO51791.1 hypothetical protein SAMN05444722_2981 [Rhodovulum sp. ES.010]
MTTWISDPRSGALIALAGLAALALAGCAGGPDATAGFGGLSFSRAAPQAVTVAGDTVTIAGPAGFCVENNATRDGDDGAFVLMASCAAVTGRENAPTPASDALLTASVAANAGPGGRPEDRAIVLERFFASEAGRAALARDGRAASVEVDEMLDRDGLFVLRARDDSAGLFPGLRNDYWRAIFDVNGRIVTASVVGFKARPISDRAGLAVLSDFADRIRTESAALARAPGAAAPAQSEIGPTPQKTGIFGFFRR